MKRYKSCSKGSKSHPEVGETKVFFFTIFQYSPFDINALEPMCKHCNPIIEEGPPNLLRCTYELIIIFKMVNMQVGFEFRKQEEVRWSLVW